jgi:antitoxin component of MazEF toxin-antitoxin module
MGAAEVCIELDGTIRIPLELLRKVGLEPGAKVRVQPDQDRLVLSRRDAIVDRLIGKIKIPSSLAIEIIETPELNVEAI